MDDIRKVPDALLRGGNGNRKAPEYTKGSQWRRCPCEGPKRPLPFYMTYPMPMTWEEEDAAARDLDYLLQLYPMKARKYRERISGILDTMDYAGSMIYDEYPDRLALTRLSEDIWKEIRKQEEDEWEKADGGGGTESEAYWERIRELLEILLYYEIYRRRRGTPSIPDRNLFRTSPTDPAAFRQGNREQDPYGMFPDPRKRGMRGERFTPPYLP